MGRANTLTAELLAHLAEVEARGIRCERAPPCTRTVCTLHLTGLLLIGQALVKGLHARKHGARASAARARRSGAYVRAWCCAGAAIRPRETPEREDSSPSPAWNSAAAPSPSIVQNCWRAEWPATERVKRARGERGGRNLALRLQTAQIVALFRPLSPLGRASIARPLSRTAGDGEWFESARRGAGEHMTRGRACNH